MRVIILGCGRVGSALAYQLYKKGHQVTVIDKEAAAFANLPADFQGRTIDGDVLTRDLLYRAEIEEADALAAVTNSDSLNALIAHIASTEYGVSRVVARNYDPHQLPLQEAFGIPVVGSAVRGAQRIEELLSDAPLRLLFSEDDENFTVYQLEVPDNWQGRPLQELLPGDRNQILAWMRAGQHLPVASTQILENGDKIYLNAEPGEIEALQRRLGVQQERSA